MIKSYAFTDFPASRLDFFGWLKDYLNDSVKTYLVWSHRATGRRQLAGMSPRMLMDIGITPEQAAGEAAKPFWVE